MDRDFPNKWFRIKRIYVDGGFSFDRIHNFSHMADVFLHVHTLTKIEDISHIDLYDEDTDKLIATFYK